MLLIFLPSLSLFNVPMILIIILFHLFYDMYHVLETSFNYCSFFGYCLIFL